MLDKLQRTCCIELDSPFCLVAAAGRSITLPLIPLASLSTLASIGDGAFGEVCRAYWHRRREGHDDIEVAVKSNGK